MTSHDDDDDRDRLLVSAHVAGDRTAFGALVSRHQDRLWAVAVRTTGNPDDAADALQDALLSVFRSLGSYRGEARVTTWLHRIVVNACLDRMRRDVRRPTVPLSAETTPVDLDDRLSQRETALDIEAALRLLPVEQRLALVLVDVEGFSVEDAATVLGVPAGTVKSRCFRARARLAVQLGHLRNRPAPPTVPPPGTVSRAGGPG